MSQPDYGASAANSPHLFVLSDQQKPCAESVRLGEIIPHLETPILVDMARDRLQKFHQAMAELSQLMDEVSRRNAQVD